MPDRRRYSLNRHGSGICIWMQMPRAGIEPATLSLGRICSIQLSYRGEERFLLDPLRSTRPIRGGLRSPTTYRTCAVSTSAMRIH